MNKRIRNRKKPVRWINERQQGIYTIPCSNNKYTRGRKVDPYERSSGYEHNSWFHIEGDNTFSGKIEDKAYLDDKENEWKEDDEDWIVPDDHEWNDDEWILDESESESESEFESEIDDEEEDYEEDTYINNNYNEEKTTKKQVQEGRYIIYLVRKILCYRKN